MRRWVPLLSALLAPLALVVAFLGPSLVGRETFLATDLLERQPPWSATSELDGEYDNSCLSDTVDGAVPDLELVAAGFAEGRWPAVTTLQVSASPLLASPTSGALSPLVLPFVGLGAAATAWIKLAEIFAVLLGCVLLLRRLGLGTPAGVVAGAALASSAFMVQWTNWPHTRTLAMAPLVLWALERFLQERTLRSAMPVPLLGAALFLGGFPAVVVHVAYLCLAWAVVRSVAVVRAEGAAALRKVLVGGAVAVAVGLALTAWQVAGLRDALSVVDLTGRSSQATSASLLPSTATVLQAVTTVVPHALGTCTESVGYWGGGPNPNETSLYTGAVVALLALVGAIWPPDVLPRGVRSVLVVAVAVVAAVVLAGWPLSGVLTQLPLMSGSPLGRLRGVGGVCVALLAGVGAHRLLVDGFDVSPRAARRRVVVVGAVSAVGAVIVGRLVLLARDGAPSAQAWDAVVPHVLLSAACAVAALVTVLVLVRGVGPARRTWLVAVLASVLAIEAVAYAGTFWSRSPADTYYRQTPVHTYLQQETGEVKIAAVGRTMYLNAPSVYGIPALTGHEFLTSSSRALLLAADPLILRNHSTAMLRSPEAMDSPVLDRLAVGYVVAAPSTLAPGQRTEVLSPDVAAPPVRVGGAAELTGTTLPEEPVRAVSLVLAEPTAADVRLDVRIEDNSGTVLARGSTTAPAGASGPVDVWVPAPPATGTSARVVVGASEQVGLLQLGDGRPWTGFVTGSADLVRVVDDGAVVYERLQALDRVRWADRVRVVDDRAAAVELVASGELRPDETVLTPDVARSVPDADGAGGSVAVVHDDGADLRVRVDAEGAGLLVVAEFLEAPGWRAEVDGRAAPLVPAEGGLAAVPVPAGEHEVTITFVQPGSPWLQLVAAATALGALGVLRPGLRRRASRDRVPS